MSYLRNHHHTTGHLDSLLCYILGVICFTYKSIIHYFKNLFFKFFDHGAWYAGSWAGIDSAPSAVEAQSLNHQTAREVPVMSYFVKGLRSVSRSFFFFWHVDAQLFQHHLLKILVLPLLFILFCWSMYLLSLFAKTILSWLQLYSKCCLVASVPPTLFFSSSIMLVVLCLLSLHINFSSGLSISTK